ncbi:formate dehydrogenase accessory sulfurtransferase FdhD [Xylophilus sp. Kf1]|nr:formate dehydrogenase accessory sulfurtransferase FdhD [Xylophilus sp. Kf1]
MGAARIGPHTGPGWVVVDQDGERWLARLTPAGAEAASQLDAPGDDRVPPPLVRVPVLRQSRADAGSEAAALAGDTGSFEDSDWIAAEVPVALVFNGISHAVMMATPQDLEDFALGFALSEGILDEAADCRGIELRTVSLPTASQDDPEAPAIELHLDISSRAFARLKDRKRSLAGRTGCGVCGIDSLSALDLLPAAGSAGPLAGIDVRGVLAAFDQLSQRQPLNARAGSLHAAGWALPDGTLVEVLEDVGRHNALDKLLGRLTRQGLLAAPGFVVMSSRGSYELVRKCTRLGVAALATISAPTALAVRIAREGDLALWGLARRDKAVRYA